MARWHWYDLLPMSSNSFSLHRVLHSLRCVWRDTAPFFSSSSRSGYSLCTGWPQNKPLIGSRQWSLLSTALSQQHIMWLVVVADSPLVDAAATTIPSDAGAEPMDAAAAARLAEELSVSVHDTTTTTSSSSPGDAQGKQADEAPAGVSASESAAVRDVPIGMLGLTGDEERSWAVRRRSRENDAAQRLLVVRALAEWKAQVREGRAVLCAQRLFFFLFCFVLFGLFSCGGSGGVARVVCGVSFFFPFLFFVSPPATFLSALRGICLP